MKLSTGKVKFPIEFDNGDVDCIYFNPNDPELCIRLTEFRDRISEKMKEFEDFELNSDGEVKEKNTIGAFNEFQKILFEELDVAFGGDVSKVVFKHCSPFAIVNGELFILQFIEAIKPEIEKHIKKATADVQKKMAKHIDKYKK